MDGMALVILVRITFFSEQRAPFFLRSKLL